MLKWPLEEKNGEWVEGKNGDGPPRRDWLIRFCTSEMGLSNEGEKNLKTKFSVLKSSWKLGLYLNM